MRKAAYTLQNLIDGMETALDDGDITSDLFKDCDAIMIITVCKLAFVSLVSSRMICFEVTIDDARKRQRNENKKMNILH